MPAVPVAPKAKPEPVEPEVAEAPPVAPEPVEPVQQTEVAAEEQPQPVTSAVEGNLQSKLTDVRAKADEARAAKLRANVALYEGLGAAYDFALDAEDSPEEYLKLVEAKGLKSAPRAHAPGGEACVRGHVRRFHDCAARGGARLGDRAGAAAWLAR